MVVETDLRRRMVWLTKTGARQREATIPICHAAHAPVAKIVSPDLARRMAHETEMLNRGSQTEQGVEMMMGSRTASSTYQHNVRR